MFNVAIVGIGNISSAHINGLLEFQERAKIVALCDIWLTIRSFYAMIMVC